MIVWVSTMKKSGDVQSSRRRLLPELRVTCSAPGGNRTPDPQLRRLLLYPTELLALQSRQAGVPQASSCQVGAPGFEPGTSCSQSRRDTRLRYAPHENPTIASRSATVNRQPQRVLASPSPARVHPPDHRTPRRRNASNNATNARPRWLTCSFCSRSIRSRTFAAISRLTSSEGSLPTFDTTTATSPG